jgi:hypothetical protein
VRFVVKYAAPDKCNGGINHEDHEDHEDFNLVIKTKLCALRGQLNSTGKSGALLVLTGRAGELFPI